MLRTENKNNNNSLLTGLRELSKYKLGEAEITIFGDYGRSVGRYIVKEPELSESGQVIYARLITEIQSSPSVGEIMSIARLKDEIDTAAQALDIQDAVEKEYHTILYRYSREILGFGKADVLFSDADLEEITMPITRESLFVIHRKFSEFNYMETNIRFDSEEEADHFVQRIMHKVNKTPSIANPIMDGTNEKGDRYSVLYGKEVSRSSTFAVRKPSPTAKTMPQLIEKDSKMLSKEAADYILAIMRAKGVVFIVGPTGTGKTTLLNAIVNECPSNWKYITIEETPEIQLKHRLWVSMFTRFSMQEKYAISIMDLVKASLRHRPDMLIVGESRGEEVQEMFQAAATGHGLVSTFHATDTEGMLSRMKGEPLNVKESFIQLVWAVITVRNVTVAAVSAATNKNSKKGGEESHKLNRRIVSIDEIVSDKGSYRIERVFSYDYASDTLVSLMKENGSASTTTTRMKEAQARGVVIKNNDDSVN